MYKYDLFDLSNKFSVCGGQSTLKIVETYFFSKSGGNIET